MLSRNTYLIPQVPPSHHPRAVVDLDGVEDLLHQHQHYHHHHHHHQQQDVFSGLYSAPALDNATLFNQENGGGLTGEPSSGVLHRKPTAKKDRHSKINTAQGPRDRRVRLSIGIARKFFDLQEVLGFDKPSKTLDWLLTKSKAAIKELVQTKQNACSSPSEDELLSSETGDDSKGKSGGKDKQAATPSLAKESRAKARARARERTLEKLCIKQLGGAGDNGSDLNPSFQCRNNQLEFLQLSAGSSSNNVKMSAGFREPLNPHCAFSTEAATRDLIEESVVIKRKSKNHPSVFGFQQNLVFSRDLNSNYIIPTANANENWDVFGFASQSNLHAILDQHKFINSNSNI